jgi:hypothetical protein
MVTSGDFRSRWPPEHKQASGDGSLGRQSVTAGPNRKAIMSKKRVTGKPGDPTPASGLYDIVGPRGGDTGKQVTGVEGKPMPPTPKPGQHFELVVPADKKAGKGE